MGLRYVFKCRELLKNQVKLRKVGSVSPKAGLLAPEVNEAVRPPFSLFRPFSPCLGLSLFLLFSFHYLPFFIIPAPPPPPPAPPFSGWAAAVLGRASLVCLAWLLQQFSVSVSRMKTRWTSSSHCYLPADSGWPPLSLLPWHNRNSCLYLGWLVFAAAPFPSAAA